MQKFTPIQYLQIDIANSAGHDGCDWDVRLAWFNDNIEEILKDEKGWAKKAKEPAQFFAGVQAYKAAQRGEASGYLCGLDATASGLQILSALAGCEQSASTCNLVNTGRREDAYTLVHSHVCMNLDDAIRNALQVTRKGCKNAVMTHFYGSKVEPKNTYGEGTKALEQFYNSIDTLMPGANALNYDLLRLWNPEALSHNWTLPDGFESRNKVTDVEKREVNFNGKQYVVETTVNKPKEDGLSMGANIVHSIDGMVVREMNRRCNYDEAKVRELMFYIHEPEPNFGCSTARYKDICLLRLLSLYDNSQFMSAVVFEFLDANNFGHLTAAQKGAVSRLLHELPQKSFYLIAIHDCFKFHANYGNDVRQQYINIMAEIADSTMLEAIVSELLGKPVPVSKYSTTLSQKIRGSEYAIC